jgi:hypothetical protein
MAFTMACLNFKKGLKMVSGPLGVKLKVLEQTEFYKTYPSLIYAHIDYPLETKNPSWHFSNLR